MQHGHPEDPDPRVARANSIIVSLREQYEEADDRALELERQTDLVKGSASLRLGEAVAEAQRRADSVVQQAREQASRGMARAEASLAANRSERRRLFDHARQAITAMLEDEDLKVTAARGSARAKLLERLQELECELGEGDGLERPLRAGSTGPAGNGLAAPSSQRSTEPAMQMPPEPAMETPTVRTVAIRVGGPEDPERAQPRAHDDESRAPPASSAADNPPRRRRWARRGVWIRNLGLLVVVFCAYQVWGTGITQARSQARLKSSFEENLVVDDRGLVGPTEPVLGDPPPEVRTPPAFPKGRAIAIVRIPRLGLEQAVVEGTSASDLRSGPGHYQGTALPGQRGNVAIAGHRTTYGAPFRRLDQLDPGDVIEVTTMAGTFEYAVSEPVAIVDPDDDWVIGDRGDDRLTLTTCHPAYSAAKRLVVVASPAAPAGFASLLPAREQTVSAPAPTPARSATLPGESSALLPALGWGLAAVAVVVGFSRLRGSAPVLAPVLAVPAGVITLFYLFDYMSRLLPAGF